jgi:putative ABC transport system permease protein
MNSLFTTMRSLTRSPVTLAAAVLTVAVAVGGMLAVFTLLESVVLRSLPYRDADRLVAVWVDFTEIADQIGIQDPKREWTNMDTHRDLRAMSNSIDDLAVFTGAAPTWTTADGAQRLSGAAVGWNGLRVLGVRPELGRDFIESDGAVEGACVVTIGNGLWQREFAADSGIVGRELTLTGEACTVVGVMPAGFRFPFIPTAEIFQVIRNPGNDRGNAYLRQFGRLADGVTLEQAQAELDTVAAALRAEYPEGNAHLELFVEPLQEALSLGVSRQLVLLQLAALLVLIVALANLASIMVARALSRAGEFAVRACLGADRWSRFRMLWVEGLVVGALGTLAGLLLAAWGTNGLIRVMPSNFAQTWDIHLGWPGFGVAFGMVFVAGTTVALVSHFALGRVTHSGAHARVAGTRGGRRVAASLIASNMALALAVTVTGVLLAQSYGQLANENLGYQPEGVLAGAVFLPGEQSSDDYVDRPAMRAAYGRLVEQVEGIPGVERVGLSSAVPLGVSNSDTGVFIEGVQAAGRDGRAHVWFSRVTEGYFDTMGIRIREGRGINSGDRIEERDVVVVNQAFVRAYLGDRPPLGTRINLGPEDDPRWFDIVGVADDVRFFDVSQPETPAVYFSAWAIPARGMYVTLRSSVATEGMIQPLRDALLAFDPGLALTDLRSMGERVETALTVPRAVSGLTVIFAICALALAGVGVYGTLAQSVERRRRELGIRRAVGAQDGDLMGLLAMQGAVPVLIGVVLGLPLAWWLGTRLTGLLYSVSPLDVRAWLSAIALLVLVAVLATALPGRRAVRVAPMDALREE